MGEFLQILGKHWAEWQKRARGRTLVRCVQGPEYSPQDFISFPIIYEMHVRDADRMLSSCWLSGHLKVISVHLCPQRF